MKKFLLVFLLFILILSKAKSQTYFKGYNLYARDNFSSDGKLIKTNDGNLVLVCVQRNCYTLEDIGITITKFNPDGSIIWSKQIKMYPIPNGADIIQTSDEGYAIGYTAFDTIPGVPYGLTSTAGLIKLNSDAEIEWNYLLDDPKGAYNIRVAQIGNSLFACYSGFQNAVHFRIDLLKFNTSGSLLFNKQYHTGNVSSFTSSLLVTSNLSLIALGIYGDSAMGTSGMFRLIVDTMGNIMDCKSFAGNVTNTVHSDIIDADGNLIFVGTEGTSYGTFGKMDPTGNIMFYKKVDFGPAYDELYDVIQTPGNNYYVVAEPESYLNKSQVGLLKFDVQGNFIWMKTYGQSEGSFPYNEILNDDGTITIAGTQASNNQAADVYLLRVDSDGNTECLAQSQTPTITDLTLTVGNGCTSNDVSSSGIAYLTEYNINLYDYSACNGAYSNAQCDTTTSLVYSILNNHTLQLLPNPTSSHLHLHYTLTQPGELMMFDALGRKVKSSMLPSNQNSFELSVAELPAGVYFVAVESEGKWWREKVVKD